jgi:hypothetical protein
MMLEEEDYFSGGDRVMFRVWPETEEVDAPFQVSLKGEYLELELPDLNRLIKRLQWMKKAYKVVI